MSPVLTHLKEKCVDKDLSADEAKREVFGDQFVMDNKPQDGGRGLPAWRGYLVLKPVLLFSSTRAPTSSLSFATTPSASVNKM